MIWPSKQQGRGQALVEFALALPLILILLLGVLDFGRAVYAYNTVANAARTGARVAIVNQDQGAITAAAADEAVGLTVVVAPISYPLDDGGCPSLGCVVRVQVTHEWTPITPIIGQVAGPLTISSTSELPVERVSP